MSESTISTLKKEITSFFNSIGLTVEFKEGGLPSIFNMNIGGKSVIGIWYPDENQLLIVFTGLSTHEKEENFSFAFDASLPSGEKLQPMYYEIEERYNSQIVFSNDSGHLKPNFSYEKIETHYFDDFDGFSSFPENLGSKLHPKKGEILFHTYEDDREFELVNSWTVTETNTIVPSLQFKSNIPEIQAWIEQQVA